MSSKKKETTESTLPVPSRKQMMAILSTMPDMFIAQFFKISAYYQGFQAMTHRTAKLNGRGRYINECERSMMMLHNMIAMASNGHPIENQVYNDIDKARDALSAGYTFFSSWTRPTYDADKEIVNNDISEEVKPLEVSTEPNTPIIAEVQESEKPTKRSRKEKSRHA